MSNSKIKLVKIKKGLPTNELGYVKRGSGHNFYGYKPGESFWAVDNNADFESSWYMLKPHVQFDGSSYFPGAIDKSHTEEVGWFKTLVALVKLGSSGAEVLNVRAENFDRRREANKAELAANLSNRDRLLAEANEKLNNALKSVEEDKKHGRISR